MLRQLATTRADWKGTLIRIYLTTYNGDRSFRVPSVTSTTGFLESDHGIQQRHVSDADIPRFHPPPESVYDHMPPHANAPGLQPSQGKDSAMERDLPERLIEMLVRSRYAALVGRTMSERLDYIAEIASLHTRDELFRERGLGRLTIRRIEKWLEFHGRRLRHADESLDSVICHFEFRKGRAKPTIRLPRAGATRPSDASSMVVRENAPQSSSPRTRELA
jgi:hypothetical protein